MTFVPVVVAALVVVGLGVSLFFLLRVRHMINKDSNKNAVGDVRVIKRGDGAYLIEEMLESKYGRMCWWEHYDIIEGNE